MRERDINDWEDRHQYTRYLIELRGKNALQACDYVERIRCGFKRKYNRFYKKPHTYKIRQEQQSDLEMILFPDSPILQAMPVYHRYIAWCLQNTKQEAATILGTNRMTLYRFLKKLGYEG